MTTTTIIRAPRGKDRPYFSTSRGAAQDKALSFEARGVLWYLLSKHDDWKVNRVDLQRAGNMGRDKVKRIIEELQAAKYLIMERTQDKAGKIVWEYRVYEVPYTEKTYMDNVEPSTEKPATVEPCTVNPHTYKEKNIQKAESTERDSAEPAKPDSVPTAVEATAPAKPKRKSTPKTLDNIKPIQAVVAYRGFGVQLQQVITGATMTRVNMVVKELRERWQNGNEVTADELKAAYVWHTSGRGEAKPLSASRDPVAVAAMVAEYREQHTTPEPPGDPDCATCGGAGLVLGATDGKQKPCPTCKAEGVTT